MNWKTWKWCILGAVIKTWGPQVHTHFKRVTVNYEQQALSNLVGKKELHRLGDGLELVGPENPRRCCNYDVARHLFEVLQEGVLDSGLMDRGMSGWLVRKIAEASEMGMMQSALDWRNCIAAPTSSSISLATCCSVPSVDHFSHAGWLFPPSMISPLNFGRRNNRSRKKEADKS